MLLFSEINWLAVSIGTIVYAAFCGIWHRQFAFGKKWEESMGFKRPENWKESSVYYIVPLIACFFTTLAIDVLLKLTHASSLGDALLIGLLSGFGIGMAIVFTTAIIPTMKKPLLFGAITGTAQALGITLAALINYIIS